MNNFGKPEPEGKLRCGIYTPEILTKNTDDEVHTENKDYRRPRPYRRSEIEEAIQVEGRQEGRCLRQYKRAEIEDDIQIEGRPERGGPRQYRRAEIEEAIQGECRSAGEAQDNTGWRR